MTHSQLGYVRFYIALSDVFARQTIVASLQSNNFWAGLRPALLFIMAHMMSHPTPDDNATPRQKQLASLYPKIATVLGIIFTVISIVVAIAPIDSGQRQLTGYGGVFLANLFGSATVLLPAPKALAVIALAGQLNPLLVGTIAGIGSGIGEATGYYIGFAASAYVPQQNRFYRVLEDWMTRYGFLTIFVCAVIPNPLFDVAGLVAGVHRYSVLRFLLAATLGNIIKNILIALIGSLLIT